MLIRNGVDGVAQARPGHPSEHRSHHGGLLMAQLPSGGSWSACHDMGLVLIQLFLAVIGFSKTVDGLFDVG